MDSQTEGPLWPAHHVGGAAAELRALQHLALALYQRLPGPVKRGGRGARPM